MLVVPVTYTFEAAQDAEKQADKAARKAADAAREILNDRNNLDRQTIEKVAKQLETTKRALAGRLISGTAYRRFTAQALAAEVDRMLLDAHRKLAVLAENVIVEAASLGDSFAEEPVIAANLPVNRSLVGLDEHTIRATYENTARLLTQPMQRFANDVKVSIRRIAVAGDNPSDEVARLRRQIEGAGIEGAYFKAERIIRTESGRTFNDATDSRLVRIADSFPAGLIGKGWRAANDRRTRLGHRQASETYARGKGIPVARLFEISVYEERPGKPPKFLGMARMRFPIDPDTTPEGRISAAATIMCRCNAFVDINTASYAAYVRSRVSIAFNPGPPDTPMPRPALPSITRERPGPQPKAAKVRPVKMKTPTPADVALSTTSVQAQGQQAASQTKQAVAFQPGEPRSNAYSVIKKTPSGRYQDLYYFASGQRSGGTGGSFKTKQALYGYWEDPWVQYLRKRDAETDDEMRHDVYDPETGQIRRFDFSKAEKPTISTKYGKIGKTKRFGGV